MRMIRDFWRLFFPPPPAPRPPRLPARDRIASGLAEADPADREVVERILDAPITLRLAIDLARRCSPEPVHGFEVRAIARAIREAQS